MIENIVQIERDDCKERLEILRENLHTLISRFGFNNENVLKVSTELDKYIIHYVNLSSEESQVI